MILKMRRDWIDKEKTKSAWEFLDHIEELTVKNTEEIIPERTFIHYKRNGEHLEQMICEECYLLNDEGKTIERIF